jgi:hypothetical protein
MHGNTLPPQHILEIVAKVLRKFAKKYILQNQKEKW